MPGDPVHLEILDDVDEDMYADGYDFALAQVTELVTQRYHAIRTGGYLTASDVQLLLEEISELGEP